MEFEKWLEEHGISAEGLDEEKLAALKAAFEKGEDPPDFGEKKDDPPKPEKLADGDGGKSPAVQAVANAREEAEGAVRAERERVASIQEICSGEFPRIERDAIRGGWTVEDTSQKVLKAMRENRPQADVHLSVNRDRGRDFDTKAELDWAAAILAETSSEPFERMDRLYQAALLHEAEGEGYSRS